MPNIKSSMKRVRSDERKANQNRNKKTELKTLLKKALSAKEQGAADTDQVVREAQAAIDRAASEGLIKKNTASRRKSRIARTHKAEA